MRERIYDSHHQSERLIKKYLKELAIYKAGEELTSKASKIKKILHIEGMRKITRTHG